VSIEQVDFESISQADLQELVDAQVPEGVRLEFKLESYGKSDSDKRELLKDVTAFANSHGGHLIIGVKEDEGVATEIVGVDINADTELLRIEQIIRNAVEPSISGLRIRAIPLSNSNKAFLLRIPKSWNPPQLFLGW
jgi:predicted HTH transcriptional regulator